MYIYNCKLYLFIILITIICICLGWDHCRLSEGRQNLIPSLKKGFESTNNNNEFKIVYWQLYCKQLGYNLKIAAIL